MSVEGGDSGIFNKRGYTMETRMQMVEIAQFDKAQKREDIQNKLTLLINRNKLLLEERQQKISMAKIICPEFDADNFHWEGVMKLQEDIKLLKAEITAEEKKRQTDTLNDNGVNLVNKVLESVTQVDVKTAIDLESESQTKSNDNTNNLTDGMDTTPSKMTIVVDQIEHVITAP